MGSEKNTDSYMGLPIPIPGVTSSGFWDAYLVQALNKIASHDHTTGNGAGLTQSSFTVTANFNMRSFGVSSTAFIGFSNPTALTVTPPNASVYYENSDLYLKDGGGNVIQLTKNGALNTSLVGGFTGDYASDNAFCSYSVSSGRIYEFYTGVNSPSQDTMAEVAVGKLTIRNTQAGKNVEGFSISTTGNISTSYGWIMPDAAATNVNSIINVTAAGVVSYLDTASFIRTTGDQTKAGVLTLSSLPVFSDTNAPVGQQGVTKTHLTSVIGALDKTSVGLGNVDNTADSNKSVASAATLTTPRTINGTSFNGSANITINPPPHAPSTNTGEFVLNYDGTNYSWVVNTGGSFPEVPGAGNFVRATGAWNALTLDSINNVDAPSPTLGDYLKYDGTNWVPAVVPAADQVSLTVTANSKGITAGNVVEIVDDGVQDLQNIYHCEAPTISSLLTLDGTNSTDYLSLAALTSNTAMLLTNSSENTNGAPVYVITAGSPPTKSSATYLNGGSQAQYISSSSLSSTQVACTYANGTNGYTRIVTAGNPPTLSTAATITVALGKQPATCALTSSNWFVAYVGSNEAILQAQSNGTNAPTLGTAVNYGFGGTNANYLSLARLSDTEAMLAYNYASVGYVKRVLSNGTNAASLTANLSLDGTNNCTYITQSPIDSNHTLCAYNNATIGQGCLAVIQANGTNAPTVISRAVFETTAAVYIALAAHSSTLHSLAWRNQAVTDGQSAVVYVDSNYNLTISQVSAAWQGTNTDTAYHALAALTPTTAICAFQGTGSDGFAGTLTLTPTPVISGQLLGIADTSATNGATASVSIGPVWETTGTLTLGADYYVDGNGGISETLSTIKVGKADTTNRLVLDLRGAPEAGKQQVWEITTPGAFTWTAPESGEYEIVLVGAGGSGAFGSGATGGNGGNSIVFVRSLFAGESVTGTLGTGGAAVTSNNNGNNGGDSTVTIAGRTYTAKGGRGGYWDVSGYTIRAAVTPANSGGTLNIPGSQGAHYLGSLIRYAGGCSLLTEAQATTTGNDGVNGSKGGGSSGGTSTTSGKGGDGVCVIRLIRGTGK